MLGLDPSIQGPGTAALAWIVGSSPTMTMTGCHNLVPLVLQVNELAGTFAGIGMGLNGALTALFVSLLVLVL
jgi:hypothetical protein